MKNIIFKTAEESVEALNKILEAYPDFKTVFSPDEAMEVFGISGGESLNQIHEIALEYVENLYSMYHEHMGYHMQ
jgi:hypothetical protein